MNTTPIDYREAFVLDMELAAHGPTCRQCMLAAIHNKPDDFCDRMKHMREYIHRAYNALPPYYKKRYEDATAEVFQYNAQAVRDIAGGREKGSAGNV